MQALLQAIVSQCQTSPKLAAFGLAGPFLGEAPETAALPYLCVNVRGEQPPARAFGGAFVQRYDVACAVYATSAVTACTAAETLSAMFDSTTFALASGTLLSCLRDGGIGLTQSGQDAANDTVYCAGVGLACWVFEESSAGL